jgi:hypothetical protein
MPLNLLLLFLEFVLTLRISSYIYLVPPASLSSEEIAFSTAHCPSENLPLGRHLESDFPLPESPLDSRSVWGEGLRNIVVS